MTEGLQAYFSWLSKIRSQAATLKQAYSIHIKAQGSTRIDAAKSKARGLVQQALQAAADVRKAAGLEARQALKAFKKKQGNMRTKKVEMQNKASEDLRQYVSNLKAFTESSTDSIARHAMKYVAAKAENTQHHLKLMRSQAQMKIEDSKQAATQHSQAQADAANADAQKRIVEAQYRLDDMTPCNETAPCKVTPCDPVELLQLSPEDAAAKIPDLRSELLDALRKETALKDAYKGSQKKWEISALKVVQQQDVVRQATAEAAEAEKAAQKQEGLVVQAKTSEQLSANKVSTAQEASDDNNKMREKSKQKNQQLELKRDQALKAISNAAADRQTAIQSAGRAAEDIKKLKQVASDAGHACIPLQHQVDKAVKRVSHSDVAVAASNKRLDSANADLEKAEGLTGINICPNPVPS